MDFASWSPSHTILVLFIIGGFIGQIAILFYRTGRLEKRVDRTDERIDKQGEMFFHALERLEDRMDKRFVEVISHTNQQIGEVRTEIGEVRAEIGGVRTELSKLNQNHIDHLTHHN